MGFLRKKTVRGRDYFYYCERRRSSKKDGGSGRVVSIDKMIGDDAINGRYLAFWLWDGLSAVDYCEALIAYQFSQFKWGLDGLSWMIEWKFRKGRPISGKLRLRSRPGSGADGRAKFPKFFREWQQGGINWVIQKQETVASSIEKLGFNLARYEAARAKLKRVEDNYQEWRKNPKREWWEGNTHWHYADDYGDSCLESIDILKENIDYWLSEYQENLDFLSEQAPRSEREKFRAAIVRRCEKLAADPHFLDRYSASAD